MAKKTPIVDGNDGLLPDAAQANPSHDRDRTQCSACGKAGAWYEFKPGDGRCGDCQP